MRTHTGERPYKCEFCDRAFVQKNDLIKHKRFHVGDNIYKCTECPAAFRFFRELQRHSNMHFLTLKNSKIDVTQETSANNSSDTAGVQQVNLHSETTTRNVQRNA